MREHPNRILALLLGIALLVATAVAASLETAGPGLLAVAAMTFGSLSACVFYLADLKHMPLSVHVLGLATLASLLSFSLAVVAYLRQQLLLRRLPLEPLEGELAAIAAGAGARLFLTRARRPAAFCFGLLRPRIVVTSGLLTQLDTEEQQAVLWHEAQHARVREPFRCLTAQLAARTLFWLPVTGALFDRYLLVRELAADRAAAARTSTRALAGALCVLAATPTPAGAVGIGDLAAPRVDRLLDPQTPLPPLFRAGAVGRTAAAAFTLALAIAFLPTRLDTDDGGFAAMLTLDWIHGLPGMTASLLLNVALLTTLVAATQRLRSRSSRRA